MDLRPPSGILAKNYVSPMKPAPPKRPGISKPPAMSDMDWANQQIQALLAQQQAAMEAQRQQAIRALDFQRQASMQRASAAAGALRGADFPSAINNAFGGAASEVSGIAHGLAATQGAAADASAAQASHLLSGSGQEGDVRNEGVGMGQVLGQAYGDIPARTLSESGRAYAEEAAKQPDLLTAQANQDAVNAYNSGLNDIWTGSSAGGGGGGSGAFDPKDVIDLARARIAMKMDILKMRAYMQDRKYKAQDRVTKARDAKTKRLMDQAELAMKEGRYEQAQKYLNLAYQREGRMAQSTAFSQSMQVTREQRQAQNQSFNQQYKLAHPPGSSSKKGHPVQESIGSWGHLQVSIASDLDSFVTPKAFGLPGPGTPQPRQKVFQALWNKYGGTVRNKGQLRRLINQILDNDPRWRKPARGNPNPNDPYGGIH